MKSLPINETLIPWVGRTAKLQRWFIANRLKAHQFDFTVEQWVLLAKLYREDGQNQNDLALITNRNKGSLARLVNILEKKNYVARIPSPEDKRVNKIFITTQGRAVFKKTIPIIEAVFEEMQEGISLEERALAIKILEKIQYNINNYEK